ncbi:hypothetical protein IPG41_04265 [Candidatus Peregrinibacteria bacterium]|nr:MAG: hypothetical protein IPG41_04265 [Candidatus Peregrinibacteria bacterium]
MKPHFFLVGAIFVVVVFLFVGFVGFGFGSESPVKPLGLGEIEEPLAPVEEEYSVTSNRYLTEAVASSFLPYDEIERLAYDPRFAFDENWGTAWCTAEALPSLTLTFDTMTDLGSVGFVPGYAVDEALFFKNARWKTVALTYNGSEQVDSVDETLSFEEVYGMQFLNSTRKMLAAFTSRFWSFTRALGTAIFVYLKSIFGVISSLLTMRKGLLKRARTTVIFWVIKSVKMARPIPMRARQKNFANEAWWSRFRSRKQGLNILFLIGESVLRLCPNMKPTELII